MSLTTNSLTNASGSSVMTVYSDNSGDKTVFCIEGEWKLQEKTPAYIFGERIVQPLLKPLLHGISNVYTKVVENIKTSLTLVDSAFQRIVALPGAEAKKLPANGLDKIKETFDPSQLTRDMLERIIQEESANEPDSLSSEEDPYFIDKLQDCLDSVVRIAGILVDQSDFANYMNGKFEGLIMAKIERLGRIKEHYDAQRSEKFKHEEDCEKESHGDDNLTKVESKLEEVMSNIEAVLSKLELYSMKIEMKEVLFGQTVKIEQEITLIQKDMAVKHATAQEIEREFNGYAGKNNTFVYSRLEVKVEVEEKLKKSLEEGVGRAEWAMDRYGLLFLDGLTEENIAKLSANDRHALDRFTRRFLEQRDMLQKIDRELFVDKRALEDLSSNRQQMGFTPQQLTQYFDNVVEGYKSLLKRMNFLKEELVELFKYTASVVKETQELRQELLKFQKKEKNEL